METSVKEKIPVLDHEKLDVYHIAIEFVILSDAIIEHIPRGRGYLSDLQLNVLGFWMFVRN